MVPIPVRVKPPPAEIGEDHLTGLGGLGDHDAAERRAITVLSSWTWATSRLGGHANCSWLAASFARSVSR